jgi:uncharacterized protein (TIGR04255 family)
LTGATVPLNLLDQPRRFYRDNPLKFVVCQIRYSVLQRFDEPGFLAEFQEGLREAFPQSSEEQQVGLSLGPAGIAQAPPARVWRFRNPEETANVAVARDFISLETTAYESWESFAAELELVLRAAQTLGISFRERLGLRYVNEMRHPEARAPAAWREYLNAELLGMVGGDVLGDDVIQALEDIRLREEDGSVDIRHGYVGPAQTDNDPFYVLDLDYYDEQGREFDVEQTLQQLTSYHQVIHNIFEMSITDAMRDHLVIREEANAPTAG